MVALTRIIIHWTGGTHKSNSLDKQHYHFIVEGDGNVVDGDLPPEENISTNDNVYGAHTLHLNAGSIGVSVCGMAAARDVPFSWGTHPLTAEQMEAMYVLVAKLCRKYQIPVTRRTVLTHAEVEPTLGIKQRGKWDIRCLPGDKGVRPAIAVGDEIRAKIQSKL